MNRHRQRLIERIRALSRPLQPSSTGMRFRAPATLLRSRTLVFDIYGTLLISGSGDVGTVAEDNRNALVEALADSGLQGEPLALLEALHESIHHRHRLAREEQGIDYPEIDIRDCWAEAFREVTGEIPEPQAIERLAVEYECRINPVWPMPGAAELLAWVRRHEFRSGIVSNAQFYTPLMLEALFGRSVADLGFDADLCLWSWQTGRGKPSPWLFEALQERLPEGERPLYVGNDMLKDIWPAATLGWHTALFAGDARSLRLRESDPRVRDIQSDSVITELLQIREILS